MCGSRLLALEPGGNPGTDGFHLSAQGQAFVSVRRFPWVVWNNSRVSSEGAKILGSEFDNGDPRRGTCTYQGHRGFVTHVSSSRLDLPARGLSPPPVTLTFCRDVPSKGHEGSDDEKNSPDMLCAASRRLCPI